LVYLELVCDFSHLVHPDSMAEAGDVSLTSTRKLSVARIDGDSVFVDMPVTCTMSDLREHIRPVLGIPVCQQKLLQGDIVLENEVVADLGEDSGDNLTVIKVVLPSKWTVEGRYCNNIKDFGPFSVAWDLDSPGDTYGIQVKINRSIVKLSEIHAFMGCFGLCMRISFKQTLGFAVGFVSGAGMPVLRGAFGSRQDYGVYHGGFHETSSDELDAVAEHLPTVGLVMGNWHNNLGETGSFSIQWEFESDDGNSGVKIMNEDMEVLPSHLVTRMFHSGLSIQFSFNDVDAAVDVFVCYGGCLALVGGFLSARDHGIYHGGFEESDE